MSASLNRCTESLARPMRSSQRKRFLVFWIFAVTAHLIPPASYAVCRVSTPNRLQPDGGISIATSDFGWFGSESLAAVIPAEGRWTGMGEAHRFRDKFWWWKRGYEAVKEPRPPLTVTASLVDDRSVSTKPFVTNAYGKDWNAILVGMEFPEPGCWRVLGTSGQENLKIILYVGD